MHLLLIACRNRRHRPAMKGILEGDDFKPVAALALMICPRGFDGAFHGFRTRIGEKHGVGKGGIDQPLGKGFALRAAIKVRYVDKRRRLILNGLGQMRMTMTQQIHRDARGKIQRATAVFRNQPSAFTADRSETAARIDWHQRRNRHGFVPSDQIFGIFQKPKSGPVRPLVSDFPL